MTRTIYDNFSKNALQELFNPSGETAIDLRIASEIREVDFLFIPDPARMSNLNRLGVLGRFGLTPAAIEPFRDPIQPEDVRACANKLFDLETDLRRKANRENRKLSQEELHKLWILSPTISERVLGGFNAQPDLVNWPTGIYVCGDEWHSDVLPR